MRAYSKRRIRILGAVLCALVLCCLSFCGCTDSANEITKEKPKVIMVTDVGGLGDRAFNDSAWEGCERAQDKISGIDIRCLESETDADLEKNIRLAAQDEATLVIGVGDTMAPAIETVAKEYPNIKFLLIDAVVEADNVKCVVFNEQEGSFLAGIAAADNTKSKIVGFVGGADSEVINRFRYGFEAGVITEDPSVRVLSVYIDSFDSQKAGKKAAEELHKKGADVIYHAAGKAGKGVIQAAGENNFMAIGVDKDQSALDSDHVLCSMVKRVDTAVFETIQSAYRGEFVSGVEEFNLKNKGISISDKAGNLTPATAETIKDWEKNIIRGIDVPYDAESFASYSVPRE